MAKDKNNQEIDLKKYSSHNNLSLRKLHFGLWLSEKRQVIGRLVIIFLTIISVFFFSYSAYNYINYFLQTKNEKNYNLTTVSAPKNQVNDLIISNIQGLKINGYYDFIAYLKNPNDRFIAYFDYCFISNEIEITCSDNFILPGEEKYLTSLNQVVNNNTSLINLEIKNVSWRRIDNREIPNWNIFLKERVNFTIDNIKIITSNGTSPSKDGQNYLEFSITNQSAYAYYEAPLNIVFYKDSQVVGVNRYIVNKFLSGETRNIRLSWKSSLIGVTRTEITPEIDILNEDVYLKYQGTIK